MNTDFYKKVEELVRKDSRYQPDAYEFVMQALGLPRTFTKVRGLRRRN
jgi:uncharacterized repeat protein (TIGR04138 family)